MIGNDIIDLADPLAVGKSRDTRFMERVFTPGEREAIISHRNRDVCLWSLWAGKEAAYKALRKIHHSLSAAPGRYEIELFPAAGSLPARGAARTPRGPVSLRFSGKSGYLHCIADTEDAAMDSIIWDVHETGRGRSSPEDQSMLLRTMITRRAACCLNESPADIDIIRARDHQGLGPPMLYVRHRKGTIDISMSHDGRFVAWALRKRA